MTTRTTWRQKLAGILEWSPAAKGLILPLMLLPILVQYMAWAQLVLARPDRARLVDVAAVEALFWQELALFAGTLAILLSGLWLRRYRPNALWFQHVTTQYYALALTFLGYQVGMNAISTGIVLLGAPVAGFIVMDRLAIWLGTATGLAATLAFSYASAFGYLPYAPVMLPAVDRAGELFHLNSMLGFAAPHFIFILILADQTLHYWRRREETIRELSRTDALTGLPNRRAILEALDTEIARTLRHGPPLAVVILDLDHFKKVNDTWGHPTGDRVLQAAASVLAGKIRKTDGVGRYGGEEFLILLPHTTQDGAATLIERCRAAIAETTVVADNGETVRMSASFGLVCNEQFPGLNSGELIKLADDALYRAKHGGRNRVEVAQPLAA